MPPSCPPALLALANGAVFYGDSVGSSGSTVGEVVFNTALTGYQEILTDPSYARQIVTLTAPHIGNTGVNEEDVEFPDAANARRISAHSAHCGDCWHRYAPLDAHAAHARRAKRLHCDGRRRC